MKKSIRCLLSILLCAIMVLGSVAVGGEGFTEALGSFSVKASAASSGTCGENVNWNLSEDGVLTISGTGDMRDYSVYDPVPWINMREIIVSVVIGSGVTSIGSYAFWGCENLTSIYIPDGVISIQASVLQGCDSLKSITIPASVANISESALSMADGITEINVDNDNEFYSNDSCGVLFNKDKSAIISYPSGNERTSYTIPDSVSSIGEEAFYNSNHLSNIIIPEGVTNIGEEAFSYCDSLVSITIPYGVEKIYYRTFDDCANLKSVVIPDSVTVIGNYSFDGCANLTDVIIPESVREIEYGAFASCESLTKINIPEGVTAIGVDAFSYCRKLEKINVDNNNQFYSSDSNGVLFNKEKTVLMQYPAGNPNTSYSIPEEVTRIVNSAFYNCNNLINVTLTDNIKTIESWTFAWCKNLERVIIPGGVETIEEFAFGQCGKLADLSIPSGVKYIGSDSFYNVLNVKYYGTLYDSRNWGAKCLNGFIDGNEVYTDESCKELCGYRGPGGEVSVKHGVETIGEGAFEGCTGITEIYIPDSVTSIGEYAFSDCENLKSITLPKKLSYISRGLFMHCLELRSVSIPSEVSGIDIEVFSGCDKINFIEVDKDNKLFVNDEHGVLYSKDKTELIQYPLGSEASSFEIPPEVKQIGYSAFAWTKNLVSIFIPGNVKEIDSSAFDYCENLETVDIAYGLKTIDGFSNCKKLKKVTIPDSVLYIRRAFVGCTNLYDIDIPDSVIFVSREAFSNSGLYNDNSNWENDLLYVDNVLISRRSNARTPFKYHTYPEAGYKNVIIRDGTVIIAESVFENCTELESVVFPESLKHICESAFSGCVNLKKIIIPENVETIGGGAFYHCSTLMDITGGGRISKLGYNAFYETGLYLDSSSWDEGILYIAGCAVDADNNSVSGSVSLHDAISCIGYGAFEDCNQISDINIPDSVIGIGNRAFWACAHISYINIPNGVISIGELAFHYCDNLKHVEIPANVREIGGGAFGYCHKLEKITVDKNNTEYSSDDYGALYNKDKTELIKYPDGNLNEHFNIPDGVTKIADDAFNVSRNLTDIVISDSVTTIGNDAFANCWNLNNVNIGSNVKTIGERAFSGCSGIADIILPETLTEIGINAFYNCSSLSKMFIPENVASIGTLAFGHCENLTSFTVDKNNRCFSNDENGVLFDKNKTVLIQYPIMNQLTKYEVPDTVKSIAHYSFYDCRYLTDIVLPKRMTTIGFDAFKNCTGLVNIVMPDYLENLDSDAFSNCTSLESCSIPYPVCVIYSGTFSGCSSLNEVSIPYSVQCIHNVAFSDCDSLTTVNYNGSDDDWNKIKIYCYTLLAIKPQNKEVPHEDDNPEQITITDNATGISIGYPDTDGYSVSLDVTENAANESMFQILGIAPGEAETSLYDIKYLIDGEESQPGGTVKVSIPIPPSYPRALLKVYHVNFDTGTFEDMNASMEDDFMVFYTDHFSSYVIVAYYNEPMSEIHTSSIRIADEKLVDYRSIVTITAKASDIPAKYRLALFIDEKKVTEGTNSEVSYEYGELKSDLNYTVKVIDANGKVQKDSNGNELSKDGGKITCKAGFFQKLIAFFKSLFKALPKVEVKP